MNISTGWVGFFDILGYSNLLQRNEPESIAQEVVPLLTGTKPAVINGIGAFIEIFEKEILHDEVKDSQLPAQVFRKLVDQLNWLLFSDTILVTMPTDETSEGKNILRLIIFYLACNMLQVKLFRAGLPLRGAIDFGRFFVQDACFAGRPIINAYELCNTLELAACVLSEVASDQLHGLVKGFGHESGLFVSEYLVPTKTEERHFFVTRAVVYERNIDIRQQVMNAFWGHKKDISIDAQRKASNTEQWLRYLDHPEEKKAAQQKSATDVLPPAAGA